VGSCRSDTDCPSGSICSDAGQRTQRLLAPLRSQAPTGAVFSSGGRCVDGSEREFSTCRADADCSPGSACRKDLIVAAAADSDDDELPDPFDNCPTVPNIDQRDSNSDGVGDACQGGAPAGVQITPDGLLALISKDVGAERWAITRNPDGTVTGNVFRPSGGEPSFVWCEQTGSDGSEVTMACSGANRCTTEACSTDEWSFIADVTLPESFFRPPAVAKTAGRRERAKGRARVQGAADAAAGVRTTPDGARTLLSKDVGGQRWAITRNPDGTVTGNVFLPAGGEPSFVWCEQTGDDGSQVSLRCLGADRCRAEPCDPARWRFIASVTLPNAFFLAP
jgi:hypothetical protein